MATQSSFITKVFTAGSFVVAAALIMPASMHFNGFATNAFAEESHEGSTGHKGTKGGSEKGHAGKGSEGHGKDSSVFKGQGEPDETSEGKGPKYGSGGRDGGKPVWASEGIPEGDYGRLNVARAPQHVRDQALAEALNTVTDWSLYLKTLTEAADAIYASNTTSIVRVDSPTQSLALYQALLRDGSIPAIGGGSAFVQAAIFLASASDKTKIVTTDTVTAMNIILGVQNPINPSTGVQATDAEMAAAAESIRLAIQTAHDE